MVAPKRNLPPESAQWGKWLEDDHVRLSGVVDRMRGIAQITSSGVATASGGGSGGGGDPLAGLQTFGTNDPNTYSTSTADGSLHLLLALTMPVTFTRDSQVLIRATADAAATDSQTGTALNLAAGCQVVVTLDGNQLNVANANFSNTLSGFTSAITNTQTGQWLLDNSIIKAVQAGSYSLTATFYGFVGNSGVAQIDDANLTASVIG